MSKRKKSESLLGLADCKPVLDRALEVPGLIYELEDVGQAINFKQRCYKYRNLLREIEAERLGTEIGVSVPYDILVIKHINKEPGKHTSRWLQFEQKEILGNMYAPDMTPVEAPKLPEPDDFI